MAKVLHQFKDYDGIVIEHDTGQNGMHTTNFLVATLEALKKIESQPVGKQMLDEIAGSGIAKKWGWRVKIHRGAGQGQVTFHNEVVRKGFLGIGRKTRRVGQQEILTTNTAVRVNEIAACDGTGTQTGVKFNPNMIVTPDGSRPAFIGLAHELVHAWRNAQGIAQGVTRTEEYETVGLSGNFDVSENLIRAEHNVPLRTNYSGV